MNTLDTLSTFFNSHFEDYISPQYGSTQFMTIMHSLHNEGFVFYVRLFTLKDEIKEKYKDSNLIKYIIEILIYFLDSDPYDLSKIAITFYHSKNGLLTIVNLGEQKLNSYNG